MFSDSVSCLIEDFRLLIYVFCFSCLEVRKSASGRCYFYLSIVVGGALIITFYNLKCFF